MTRLLLFILIGILALAAYIRLAPSDVTRWHIDPRDAADPGPGGVLRLSALQSAEAPEVLLAGLDAVARADGAHLLAGAPEDGQMTWIARSRIWGFPDYITARVEPIEDGSTLHILSRLRFGRSDLGVNAARVNRWLAALEAQ